MKTLIIVRHCERLDSIDSTWTAHTHSPYDPPLSDAGLEQAHNLATEIASQLSCLGSPQMVILSSPFLRCVQTSLAISSVTKSPLKLCTALGEWMTPDYFQHGSPPGDDGLSGLVKSSYDWILMQPLPVRSQYLGRVNFLWDVEALGPSGQYGEEWHEMYDRAEAALNAVEKGFSEDVIVIVSHGALCNSMLSILRNVATVQEVPVASWQTVTVGK